MKKTLKISFSCLLAILIMCSSIVSVTAATESTEGFAIAYESAQQGSLTLVNGDTYTYGGGYPANQMTVNGKTAVCAWQEKYNPPDGTVTATKYYLANNDLRSKIFYWLLVGTDSTARQYQTATKAAWNNAKSSDDSESYWADSWVHSAIDYLQQGSQTVYGTERWEAVMLRFINTAKNWNDVPEGAKVFYYYPNGTASQSVMSYEVNGYVKIIKRSAKPDVTDSNSAYSLEGARFSFYTDANCSDSSYIGFVTTDKDGVAYSKDGSRASLRKLMLGTYYVKETIPPKGFDLDNTVFTVRVTEANVITNPVQITVTDNPKKVYAKIIKKSSNPELTDRLDGHNGKEVHPLCITVLK